MSQRQTTLLRQIIAWTGQSAVPDAQLLRRFVESRDEAAFVELHRRHGPLVWATCRHLLPNPADAEDAYQITFLALVQSAGRIRQGAALGAWLHGVAVRTATRLQRTAVRRRRREERAAVVEADPTLPEAAWEAWLAAVHEEVERLPESVRTAFVLCELQGLRQPEAAALLGWKPGTLTGRLCKARQQVLQRLQARGIAPALAAAALTTAATTASAALLPASLTIAVNGFGTGAAVAPPSLLLLASEVSSMQHAKWITAGVLVLGAVGLWLGSALVPQADGQQPSGSPPAPEQHAPAPLLRSTATEAGPRYKYVPLSEGHAADTFQGTTTLLETEAARGWEFCGSLDMALTPGQHRALRAERPPAAEDAAGLSINRRFLDAAGGLKVYRVLVFKQRVAPVKQATIRIPVRQRDAQRMAVLLTSLMEEQRAQVLPDPHTNTWIVTADVEIIAKLQNFIAKLDMEERGSNNDPPVQQAIRDSERIHLKWSPAESVSKILAQVFHQQPGVNVTISVDTVTNSLIVQGDQATRQRIRQIVDTIETEFQSKKPPKP